MASAAADLPWPKSPRPTKLPIVKYDSYGKCNGQLFQIHLATTSVQDGTLSTPPSATATLTFTLKGRQRQRGFTTLNRRKATNTVPATLELAGFECGQDDAPLQSSAVASPNAPPSKIRRHSVKNARFWVKVFGPRYRGGEPREEVCFYPQTFESDDADDGVARQHLQVRWRSVLKWYAHAL